MVNNSKYNKIVFFAFGLIFAFFVIFSLYFMTRYAYIIVYYTVNSEGQKVYSEDAGVMSYTNSFLFNRFWNGVFKNTGEVYSAKEGWNISKTFVDRDEFYKFIVDYREQLNSFNTGLLWYGVIGLIVFAAMLIVGNHNRNVYYITNIIFGVICPLIMIIFGIVLLVKDLNLLSQFNENKEFWQAVSIAQNKGNDSSVQLQYRKFIQTQDIDSYYKGDTTNSTTLVMTMIFLIISIGYSIFTMVHSIRKYFATKARRQEIIERAGVIAWLMNKKIRRL